MECLFFFSSVMCQLQNLNFNNLFFATQKPQKLIFCEEYWYHHIYLPTRTKYIVFLAEKLLEESDEIDVKQMIRIDLIEL